MVVCILSAGADGRSTLDITYHLQAASRAFFAKVQFGFVSLTGSLHLLPFLLLAIEQSGWANCTNWMLFSQNAAYDRRAAKFHAPWHDILDNWNGKAAGSEFQP